MKKNFPLLALIAGIAMILFSFGKSQTDVGVEINPNKTFKNLKILPKGISDDDLKAIMRNFNASLGVKCSHCHAPGDDGKMDFASDANPIKTTTRQMMKMTMGINKKYFQTKNPIEFQVKCFTCYRGKTHPQTMPPIPEPKK